MYIKKLIEENIPNAVFVKSTQKNKPERLLSTLTQEEAVPHYQDTFVDENDMKSQWKLAKKLCREILQYKSTFSGNFDCFESPALLTTFMEWLLLGTCTNKYLPEDQTPEIEKLLKT